MKKLLCVFVLFLSVFDAHALDKAQVLRDNAHLTALYQADQNERQLIFRASAARRDVIAAQVWKNDARRIEEVRNLLREHGIATAEDYWHAAFIMQHGENEGDIQLAHSFSIIATELSPGEKKYRWLTAASWDRILTRRKQPQWYGTQFQAEKSSGKQVLAPVASGVITDEERKALGVPTLQESMEMERQLNSNPSK